MMNDDDKAIINDIVTRRYNMKTQLTVVFLGDYEGLFSLKQGIEEDYLVTIQQLIRDLREILKKDIVLKSLLRKQKDTYNLMLYI